MLAIGNGAKKEILEQIKPQLVSNPEESGFYKPFRNMPAGIPQAEKDRLQAAAKAAKAASHLKSFKRGQ